MSIATESLDQMYTRLTAGIEQFNAGQDNPLKIPVGFHYAVSARGEDAGLGFYCQRCKIHVPTHADEVKHCGTVSTPPTGFFARRRMKTFRLRVY
jgi:hypothetical protein